MRLSLKKKTGFHTSTPPRVVPGKEETIRDIGEKEVGLAASSGRESGAREGGEDMMRYN
jgi:hypothetical protein